MAQQEQKAKTPTSKEQGGDEEGDQDFDPAGKLIFDENDALTFDPEKFFKLITQMERQKSAYALQTEGGDK